MTNIINELTAEDIAGLKELWMMPHRRAIEQETIDRLQKFNLYQTPGPHNAPLTYEGAKVVHELIKQNRLTPI